MRNTTLVDTANTIMASTTPAQFLMTAQFINSDSSSTFSFYPLLGIESLMITRDYLSNYADVIDIKFKISLKDYGLLQDQGQNLLCILTITYVDKYGRKIYTPAPIQKKYNVLIKDPRDIRKAVPDTQYYTEPTTDITLQLVEPTIYNLRHTKINTVYQNVTMEQAIHSVTQFFSIEKIQMVTLDSTHQYDHIAITSYQGIDSIFGYLQKEYGMYFKGSTAYITDGVLYIYPPFETAPSYDKKAIFYQVGTGNFAGSSVFHKVSGKTTSIVINSQPESYDLSIAGSENHGTGFIFTRGTRMTDGFTSIDSNNGAKFTDQPALSVSLNNSRSVVDKSNNVFHIPATDNPYPSTSKIIAHQASVMQVNWMHADPFLLDPGHAITYFYDRNEVMVSKTGILENAVYKVSSLAKQNGLDMYGAVGQLTLRLSPNETIVLNGSGTTTS